MRILLVADQEKPALWDYYTPGKLDDIDLIISCGDLDAEYLSFLVTMSGVPVLYVHGNHDGRYAEYPPEGCDCIEDALVTVEGLRILGLGGSMMYNGGEHQYTELQMMMRMAKLWWKLLRHGGADIVVTHAPIRGYGDGEDTAHRGFMCFLKLLDRVRPKYWVHGHVHLNYGRNPRILKRGNTTIINAYESYILEL